MKKQFWVGLATGMLMLSYSGMANALVINFDDYYSGTTFTTDIADGYGGFNWEMGIIYNDYHAGSGYDIGTVSGDYAAWNYQPASVSSSTDFDFTGAFFTSAWDTTLSIVIEGWNSGMQLYSDTITVSNSSSSWQQIDFLGIDELKIISLGSQFVMDDFTYNESSSNAAVPEPGTMLLMGTGLLGLLGYNRKRVNKKR